MFHKTVLPNGVRILSETLPHFQSISLGIWVDVGSRDEDNQKNGISHFIEHMIFKGTRRRTNLQIAKELDAIGGLSNAFTGKENTCFHSRVLARHFEELSDILIDIFLNSIFDPQEMERERLVILQEINMVGDSPEDLIHVIFHNVFWPAHPIGLPILGTTESVLNINKKLLIDYIKNSYTPDRIVISCAGAIEHKRLVEQFRPFLESLPTGGGHRRHKPSIASGLTCNEKDLEQVHICLGGEAPPISDRRRFSASVLNTILGGNMSSRLFQEIREKMALAYSVYSFISAYRDTGMFGIYVACSPDKVNATLEIIQREIRKIKKGHISQSDVDEAVDHLIGGLLLSCESTENIMMRIAKNEFVFGEYLSIDDLIEELKDVKATDVVNIANESFRENGITFASLGPLKKSDIEVDISKM